ncbi:hypothetical protein ACWDTQ_24955, partial [Streptomyces cellulosae]
SYRKASPEAAADDLAAIREPNVFIVDDVAFIPQGRGELREQPQHTRRANSRVRTHPRGARNCAKYSPRTRRNPQGRLRGAHPYR